MLPRYLMLVPHLPDWTDHKPTTQSFQDLWWGNTSDGALSNSWQIIRPMSSQIIETMALQYIEIHCTWFIFVVILSSRIIWIFTALRCMSYYSISYPTRKAQGLLVHSRKSIFSPWPPSGRNIWGRQVERFNPLKTSPSAMNFKKQREYLAN